MANGRLLDWNFRRIAVAKGVPLDKKRAKDLKDFPIEMARLQTVLPILIPGAAVFICYGWVLQQAAPLAVTMVLQFLMGMSLTAVASTGGTLLVDLYPGTPALVTASNNFTRCFLGAGATALIQPMIDGMGVGWCFVLIGLVCLALAPIMLILIAKGPKWRTERLHRLEQKESGKAISSG
jgi:MFS family permease